ncbi:MaoC family dehydratase [Halobacteria archaeon AArc-curdl1]|uniref:MaoC family dehydratase n=1 Tax=Natronosalvus hydrolyticus TaxID=2979988 RepID=A0AAP3E833_9EURY|nr:MaoC family dehydratase [Halobacteria archaeon AArc-curdl1]
MSIAQPGDQTRSRREITTDRIEQFADITGDDNPLHLDADYAAAGLFDGRISHGMLAAGVISSALAKLPGDIIYLSQDLSFEQPVYPGETVTATAHVVEALGDNQFRVETVARTDDDIVVDGEATVLALARDEVAD